MLGWGSRGVMLASQASGLSADIQHVVWHLTAHLQHAVLAAIPSHCMCWVHYTLNRASATAPARSIRSSRFSQSWGAAWRTCCPQTARHSRWALRWCRKSCPRCSAHWTSCTHAVWCTGARSKAGQHVNALAWHIWRKKCLYCLCLCRLCVARRDIKPGNIVSVGRRGTFKLIDMDSMFFARSCQLHPQQRYSMGVPCPRAASTHLAGQAAAAVAATAAAAVTLQRQQQQLLQEEEHHGDNDLIFDIPAADNQQQQQKKQKWRHSLLPLSRRRRRAAAAAAAATAGGSHYEGELNALSFSGTPENMAPEAAPLVVETPLLLMDLLPLREGKQLPSATPVSPSQDIWSAGTVLWELVMGRWVACVGGG